MEGLVGLEFPHSQPLFLSHVQRSLPWAKLWPLRTRLSKLQRQILAEDLWKGWNWMFEQLAQ